MFILEALENADKQWPWPTSGSQSSKFVVPALGSSPLHLRVLGLLVKSSIDFNSLDLLEAGGI